MHSAVERPRTPALLGGQLGYWIGFVLLFPSLVVYEVFAVLD
jgi:hypothetical protein